MIENLLIARDNKYGLTRDAVLLAQALPDGGETKIVAARGRSLWARWFGGKIAKRAFHFERVHGMWLSAAEQHILIPNPEHFPLRLVPQLQRIDRVFAKTRHAEQIFSALGVETAYTGFTSEDRFMPSIEKNWNRFLHLAGASVAKGTETVLQLWEKHLEWPELVLVQKQKNAPRQVPANVTLVSGYLDDKKLKDLQNGCGIHLCPSKAEGWGHHIVEAMSCGAVIVTTDAPPMNEQIAAGCGVLVPYRSARPRKLGTYYDVDAKALEAAIQSLIGTQDAEKAALGRRARERYLEIDAGFRGRLRKALLQT